MRYRESEEMYLETIYVLTENHSDVRSIDIAKKLGYSKPSVCVAMKRLKEKDYITVADSGAIRLTEIGMEAAIRVYERHHLLTQFFTYIGAERSVSEENACRIEHVISTELVEVIRRYLHRELQAK